MSALVVAELRRQIGRRGSFIGSTAVVTVGALLLVVWALTTSGNPSRTEVISNGREIVSALTLICGIVIGAIAGAWDTDQGTMRYLVLTGRPRVQLVLARFLALPVTVLLIAIPGLLIVTVAQFLGQPSGPFEAAGLAGGWPPMLDLVWGVWLSGTLYGLLSLAIGTLFKSNAVAITFAIVLNFAGVIIASLVWEYVSHALANLIFPVVASGVISHEGSTAGGDPYDPAIGFGASAVVLTIWLVSLFGLAWLRVQRSEY